MTAKEYLEQVRSYRQEIIQLSEQIETIRTDVSSYHPLQLDDTGASHLNYRTDKLSEKMAAVVDLYIELEDRRADLILKEAEIRKKVSDLSDPGERELLTLRYLTINPRRVYAPIGWKEIARKMSYSVEGVKKIHKRSLLHFSEIIKEYP